MRAALIAFALGILLLQHLPALPDTLTCILLLAVAALLLIAWRCSRGRLMGAFAVFACALIGFCAAAWLAHERLSDALPEAWESKEIQLTGVVASLPQRFERGERFEFDVDAVHTSGAQVPRHIQLSWYHS